MRGPTDETGTRALSRRRLLAATGAAGTAVLAGCSNPFGSQQGAAATADISQFRGSGPLVSARDRPGGTSIAELPDLEGTISLYLGGGEGGLYRALLDLFKNIYPEFDYAPRVDSSASLANTVITEVDAGASRADVFIAVDAGSLAAVAQAGAARELPSSVTDPVVEDFATDRWVGFAGRARAVPYNTDQLAASDVPDSVQAFPDAGIFTDGLGWAPAYSAFQAFVTAMRLLRGEDTTRRWLNGVQSAGAVEYPNEFAVSGDVADGEITAGFANHYYALRVQNARPEASLDLAFTSGDAGALINASGGLVVEGTRREELAENLLRHLASAEAQEFFATRTFAYPTVPDVAPAGGLPTIDELNLPDIDLRELSDQDATLDLLRETGVL